MARREREKTGILVFTRFFGSFGFEELEPAVGSEILCGVLAREATPGRSGKEEGVDIVVESGTCN